MNKEIKITEIKRIDCKVCEKNTAVFCGFRYDKMAFFCEKCKKFTYKNE